MHFFLGKSVLAGTAAIVLTTSIAAAQTVTLNGAPLDLNPPPQTRDGRVFVPLRGVFERLGASVVYDNGTINAQGNGRSVSLRIGSNQATVDGQSQIMDVAPFIIGSSTYVPLRFVSQALGATVNYDQGNDVVALSMNGGGQQQNRQSEAAFQQQQQRQQQMQADQQRADQQRQQQIAQQQQNQAQQQEQQRLDQQHQDQLRQQQQQPSPMTMRDQRPGRDANVPSQRPSIEVGFANAQADPNSIRVELDGVNVTDQSSRSTDGIVFSPPSNLRSGRHQMHVYGNDTHGQPFSFTWEFASGASPVSNTIRNLRPGDDANVPSHFTVSGTTMPGARVVIQVGTANGQQNHGMLGAIFGVGNSPNSNARSEVYADGSGNFHSAIELDARAGQQLTLVVDSTDARSQASAPRVVRNLTVQ